MLFLAAGQIRPMDSDPDLWIRDLAGARDFNLNFSLIPLSGKQPSGYESFPAMAVTDQFGQWDNHSWPGKIISDTDFEKQKAELVAEGNLNKDFPEEFSSYGGWKELRFESTGFFHMHFDGQGWWFVDPEGFAFLASEWIA